MDVSKLTTGDKVIGGSALVLLISMFLTWYDFTISGLGTGGGRNGFHYFFTGLIPFLLVLALVVLIGLQRFSDVKLPELPITWEQAYAIAGGVAGVLILLRLIFVDKISGFGFHVDGNRKFGLIIAVLAAIGVIVGGAMNMREAPASDDSAPPAPPVPPV